MLFSRLLLGLLLVEELSIIKYPANRGIGVGSNLYQIIPLSRSHPHRFLNGKDTNHLLIYADYSYVVGSNFVIYAVTTSWFGRRPGKASSNLSPPLFDFLLEAFNRFGQRKRSQITLTVPSHGKGIFFSLSCAKHDHVGNLLGLELTYLCTYLFS